MPNNSDYDRDTFEVEIEGTEERFRGIFLSYRVNSNYMTPTDEFEFVVYSEDDEFNLRRRWRPLQPIKLYINGACQLIGRIDGIEGIPESGTALRVFGRDYLADLVDATVDPLFMVQKDWTIEQALQQLFRPFGIDTISADNFEALELLVGNVAGATIKRGKGKRKRETKLSDFKAEDNLGVMELANKIVARHGFLILPAGRRNEVIVDSPNYDQEPLFQYTRPGNILKASARRDWSNVPTITIARGRTGEANDSAAGGRSEYPTFTGSRAPTTIAKHPEVERILDRFDGVAAVLEERADPTSRATPLAGTLYRPLFYRDRDSRNQEQIDNGVRRMIAERLRETLTYTVEMRGHCDPDTGAVYSVDTLADVNDTVEDLQERLWCFDRTFENTGSGPKAVTKYIRPESYVLNDATLASATANRSKPIAKRDPLKDAAARAAAAEKFVRENFSTPAGPNDLLEGLRRP